MRPLEYLYPVSVALDITAVAATSAFPILALVSFIRSGWRQGRVTTAYLGYVCCALLVMSFTLHLALDGGDVFMMFQFWAFPFAVAAAIALLMTLATASGGTLWMLALATAMLVLAQTCAERQPGGIGGAVATLMLVAYCSYALLVLGLSARRRLEWWKWSRDQA